MLICYLASIGLISAYWAFAAWNNKQRRCKGDGGYNNDREECVSDTNHETQDILAELFSDQTDFQQRNFLYIT